jgi:hypothetical protein
MLADLFAEYASPNGIDIVDKGRGEFIRFSITDVPYIGLWLNYGAWSGAGAEPYYNIGVEPTTAPHDDLSHAIGQKVDLRLLKNESRHWQFTVTGGTLVNQDKSA